jgi:glycosyltransferase involved in cell wall biosynthesis
MKVAIVHYWLVRMRGGEKMLEALLELFPDADIFTHVYQPVSISKKITRHRIYTSYINRLPFADRLYPLYMPLMPSALLDFDMQKYDLVISSEAGPAKGIVPAPTAYHICYCHSPMRYIWDMYHEYAREAGFIKRFFLRFFAPSLRIWDVNSANLVDRFITNSNYTARRIKRYYNRDADVVFGPCDIERYKAVPREPLDFYLFFGQITYNKRADIAIDACINLGKKLIVAGAISDKKLIARYINEPLISFTGSVNNDEIERYLSQAKALLFPGIEDMGLVPIEAQAAGCPVIAYRDGGVLDTLLEGVTGLFFEEQNAASLASKLEYFEDNEILYKNRDAFTAHVEHFSKKTFLERIQKIINERKRI